MVAMARALQHRLGQSSRRPVRVCGTGSARSPRPRTGSARSAGPARRSARRSVRHPADAVPLARLPLGLGRPLLRPREVERVVGPRPRGRAARRLHPGGRPGGRGVRRPRQVDASRSPATRGCRPRTGRARRPRPPAPRCCTWRSGPTRPTSPRDERGRGSSSPGGGERRRRRSATSRRPAAASSTEGVNHTACTMLRPPVLDRPAHVRAEQRGAGARDVGLDVGGVDGAQVAVAHQVEPADPVGLRGVALAAGHVGAGDDGSDRLVVRQEVAAVLRLGRSGDATAVGDGDEAAATDEEGAVEGVAGSGEPASSVHPASASARQAARRTATPSPAVRHGVPSVHSLSSAAIVPPSSYAASRSALAHLAEHLEHRGGPPPGQSADDGLHRPHRPGGVVATVHPQPERAPAPGPAGRRPVVGQGPAGLEEDRVEEVLERPRHVAEVGRRAEQVAVGGQHVLGGGRQGLPLDDLDTGDRVVPRRRPAPRRSALRTRGVGEWWTTSRRAMGRG